MSRFVTAAAMSQHKFGPMQFYRLAGQIFANKTHLSWDDWNEFFELAHECGMTAGEELTKGSWSAAYPEVTRALTLAWRRVKAAQETGISAYEFHCNEQARFKAADDAVHAQQVQYAYERKATQQAAKTLSSKRRVAEY